MVNVKYKICEEENCIRYGYYYFTENKHLRYCGKHRHPEMTLAKYREKRKNNN